MSFLVYNNSSNFFLSLSLETIQECMSHLDTQNLKTLRVVSPFFLNLIDTPRILDIHKNNRIICLLVKKDKHANFIANYIAQNKFININLSSNPITDDFLKDFFKVNPLIKYFDLNLCSAITDQGINYLAKCVNLEYLDLSNNSNITEKSLIHIAQECPNLSHLNLTNSSINYEKILLSLSNFKNLKTLQLNRCYNQNKDLYLETIEDTLYLIKNNEEKTPILEERKNTSLNEVNFSHSDLTDDLLIFFVKHCLSLKHINVSNCENLTDMGFWELSNFSKLESIDFSNSPYLTDAVLYDFGKNCSQLKNINLCHSNITDDGVYNLCYNNKANENSEYPTNIFNELECISLSYTEITDDSLFYISQTCPNLREINLENCEYITDQGLEYLSDGCPKLEILDISDNFHITDKCLISFRDKCLNLKRINCYRCRGLCFLGGSFPNWNIILSTFGKLECIDITPPNRDNPT